MMSNLKKSELKKTEEQSEKMKNIVPCFGGEGVHAAHTRARADNDSIIDGTRIAAATTATTVLR